MYYEFMLRMFRRESVFVVVDCFPAPVFVTLRSKEDKLIGSSSKTGIGSIEGSGELRKALDEKCDSLVGSAFFVPFVGVCRFCCPIGGLLPFDLDAF